MDTHPNPDFRPLDVARIASGLSALTARERDVALGALMGATHPEITDTRDTLVDAFTEATALDYDLGGPVIPVAGEIDWMVELLFRALNQITIGLLSCGVLADEIVDEAYRLDDLRNAIEDEPYAA